MIPWRDGGGETPQKMMEPGRVKRRRGYAGGTEEEDESKGAIVRRISSIAAGELLAPRRFPGSCGNAGVDSR